jgi:hypothetical protein
LPFGAVFDLKTHDLSWESTHEPCIAKGKSGTMYVVWDAKNRVHYRNATDIAKIPQGFLNESLNDKWNSVVGLSIFDGRKWFTPNLLVDGNYQCDPVYAWCEEDKLHLLVKAPDDSLHHLRYSPQENKWTKLFKLGNPAVRVILPRFVCYRNGILHCVPWGLSGTSYIRYDGKEWSKPQELTDEADTQSRPRLAVADGSKVHVVWNEGDKTTHVIIEGDRVQKSAIPSAGAAIDGYHFDIAALSSGHILMAYKASDAANPNAVYVREWDGKKWCPPIALAGDSGLNLGAV